jgi:hypothetical protein
MNDNYQIKSLQFYSLSVKKNSERSKECEREDQNMDEQQQPQQHIGYEWSYVKFRRRSRAQKGRRIIINGALTETEL